MAVFRIEKTRDYTVMSNYHLRDMSLSLKAKGLLSLMLSLPENWDYIEYDVLSQNVQLDKDRLDELVELMVDTVCSNREMIRVAGDDYPAEVVRSRFLKLNASHIEYVLDRMRENTTYIRNIKKYLLAALYNAPVTMDSYYMSLVSHDLYGSGDRR